MCDAPRFSDAWLARLYRTIPAESMDQVDMLLTEFRRLRDQELQAIETTDTLIQGVKDTNASLERARHPMRFA